MCDVRLWPTCDDKKHHGFAYSPWSLSVIRTFRPLVAPGDTLDLNF